MAGRSRWGRGDYGDRYGGYGRWAPYVPVAKRRAQATAYAKTLEKKQGRKLAPVKVDGRKIATSFWGQAWCDNLEAYSDFSNRLPRGRTYVRNGSVIDLSISQGQITALVSGSSVYSVTISIDTLPAKAWREILRDCSQSIGSLIDLLQGRFDRGVMQRLTLTEGGLFPKPQEIKMKCSCPDYAGLCKHIAAVLYGVGARLDQSPEMLFTLRNVNHLDLIGQAIAVENLDQALAADSAETLPSGDLAQLFGIELESSASVTTQAGLPTKTRQRRATAKVAPPKTRRATEQAQKLPVEKPTRASITAVASAAERSPTRLRKPKKHSPQVKNKPRAKTNELPTSTKTSRRSRPAK